MFRQDRCFASVGGAMTVIDFKIPKDVCPYCGEQESHTGFSCPRIRSVTHHEATANEPAAITLTLGDEMTFELLDD